MAAPILCDDTGMPVGEAQFEEWKRAYRVLGVPPSATSLGVKEAYRKLLKRWHPDLVPGGTPQHAEATQMVKTINQAYAAIQGAPLRYYLGTASSGPAPAPGAGQQVRRTSPTQRDAPPKTDWIEFWVRFVCGFFFGVLAGLRILFYGLNSFGRFVAIDLGIAVVCGLAAARYGDKFWYTVFRRWWMWD